MKRGAQKQKATRRWLFVADSLARAATYFEAAEAAASTTAEAAAVTAEAASAVAEAAEAAASMAGAAAEAAAAAASSFLPQADRAAAATRAASRKDLFMGILETKGSNKITGNSGSTLFVRASSSSKTRKARVHPVPSQTLYTI
jgi:membrane protein involved in colicin uptake